MVGTKIIENYDAEMARNGGRVPVSHLQFGIKHDGAVEWAITYRGITECGNEITINERRRNLAK